MTFDVKNETIGHLYETSIFRCNFFFLVNSKDISTMQCRSKTYFENDFLLFVRGEFNMLCGI
jgi:hypothetical protein